MNQNSQNRPAFAKKRDIIILVTILALLGLWTLWSYVLQPSLQKDSDLKYAWIYHDNVLLEKVPLDGTERRWELKVPEEPNSHHHADIMVETYKDGSIAVVHANCPDQICVHTGRVSRAGQSIACLPNHVIIKIGTKDSPGGPGLDG